MDHNLYHTIFWGIEVKITDILMWSVNFGVIGFCILLVLLSNSVGWIRAQKNHKVITIGQLVHLADIYNNKLYAWKNTNKNMNVKKKPLYKSVKSRPLLNSEEIVCNTCGLSIKTNSVAFT